MPSGTSAKQRQQKLRYINILPTIGFGKFLYICIRITEVNGSGCNNGALAHLARALDWQSKGDRFESDMLHKKAATGPLLFFLIPGFREAVSPGLLWHQVLAVSVPILQCSVCPLPFSYRHSDMRYLPVAGLSQYFPSAY